MRNILNNFDKKPGIILSASIALVYMVAYRVWIFHLSVITQGDWWYYFKQTLITLRINYFSLWLSDTSFGRVLVDAGQAPTYALYGFLAKFVNITFPVSERLIQFWPLLIVTPIGIWKLLDSILESPWAVWSGTMVYCFNTYLLSLQTGDVTLASGWAFAPLVIFLFRKSLSSMKVQDGVITGLVACICCAYEPRTFYVTAWVMLLITVFEGYSLVRHERPGTRLRAFLRRSFAAGLPVLIISFINAYWVIGLSKVQGPIGQGVISSSLFGDTYFNTKEALTLFYPYWSGSKIVAFMVQPIPGYFWIIPAIALAGLYVSRKRPEVIFFGAIGILGVLLAKQVDAPFPLLYLWLFNHLPGFNAFREASKFYFLIALGYAVMIGAFIDWLFKQGNMRKVSLVVAYGVSVLVSAIFVYNTRPFVTSAIGTLFVARSEPNDYILLNDFLLKDKSFARTYWAPTKIRWGIYTELHPIVSGIDLIQNDWNALWPSGDKTPNVTEAESITSILRQNYAHELFDLGAIKYLIVPSRDTANDDDVFVGNGNDRQYYVDALKQPWLKQINIGTREVAVFENSTSRPYISSLATVTHLDSIQALSNKYQFVTTGLNDEFAFSPPASSETAVSVLDPFEALGRGFVRSNTVTSPISNTGPSTAYINANQFDLVYQMSVGALEFSQHRVVELKADGVPVGPQTNQTSVIDKTPLNASGEFYISVGGDLAALDLRDPRPHDLGRITSAPIVYAAKPGNRVNNPDLENGLWRPVVEDCNNYDDAPVLNMSLVNDPQEVTQVLQLSAYRHTACTGPDPVAVTPGEQLMLSFDYRVVKGQESGYQFVWEGAGVATVRNYLHVTDSSWRTERTLVTVPAGATTLRVLLEAFPNDQNPVEGIDRYTNIRITGVTAVDKPPVNITPQYVSVPVPSGTKTLSVTEPGLTGQNLIPNPSLESGLWQKTVGDCNAYDDNPDISMKLDTTDHSAGKQSLELDAKRHNACTGPNAVDIQENHSYLLSFDYQSPNAATASYSISFNDPNHTSVSNNSIPVKGSGWQTYNQSFTAPFGATQASLTVYADAVDPPTTTIINRYDNFRLVEIPDVAGQYYIVSGNQTPLTKPKDITFTLSSPTKKLIHITGATTPFYLAMSEAYHPDWRLELANSRVEGFLTSWVPWVHPDAVSNTDHFDLDDFLNGWYVDPKALCKSNPTGCTINKDGSYNLEMIAEFAPQRWFYVGLVISVTTLLACIGYLLWVWRRRWPVAVQWTNHAIGIPQAWGRLLLRHSRPNVDAIRRGPPKDRK